jgi:DUF4097 and DUF4098 domain-containing protein YvlB
MFSPPLVRALAFLVVGVASVACSIDVRGNEASTREEKRFTVSATDPVDLKIETFDGAIAIRSWDKNEVLVEIERRGPDQAAAEALVVNQMQEGNRISIEAPSPRNERNVITVGSWQSQSVNFTVTAPRRVMLQARTGDGSVEARDLQGTIDVNSGDGRIVASNLEGDVKVHTGDGTINIDRAAGRVDADSGDGSIEIDGRLDVLTVRTGDGPVRVNAANGSTMKSDWQIAAVDASTGDGSVRVEGISKGTRDGDEDRSRVVGQLGSGGANLMLRSGDGSVDVTR